MGALYYVNDHHAPILKISNTSPFWFEGSSLYRHPLGFVGWALNPRFYMLDSKMLEALCNLPDLEELHAYYLQEAQRGMWYLLGCPPAQDASHPQGLLYIFSEGSL